MDATQLSLLLTARFQSNTKPSLQFGEDGAGGDTSFAELLKKRALEQADLQRQIELDRQHWRNQPSSYAASRPASTTNAAAATTDQVRGSSEGDKRPTKADARGESSGTQSEPRRNSVKGDASQGSSTSQESSATPASRKPVKPKANSADDSEAAGSQSVPANANTADTTKPALQADQSANDGTSGNGQQGQGQDQGQNQASNQDQGDGAQDGGQQAQQQAADGIALANSVAGTVLAGLMMGQTPAANGANGAQPTATGLGPAGVTAAGDGNGAAGTGLDTAMAAQANAAAAAQGAPVPGAVLPETAPAAAADSAAGLDNTAAPPLPQGAAAPTQSRAAAQELATAFASIVAKNAQSTAPAADNGRISIVKTDSAPQMPKPLVKIGNDHASFSPAEPTEATPAETGPAETAPTTGFGTGFDADDYSSSDLRTFSSYSPLLAGGSLAVAGKQADALTALRQQLAGASIQDQVAIHMQRAIKDNVDKISIQLSPTELGRIHVKMSVDDDKNVTATITVERPATLDLLQRDTKALERALQEAGLKTDSGSLSFSLQRGNQGDSSDTPGWSQGNGRRIGSSGQENSATLAEVSSATAGNEVDTANGLVNVAV